MIETLKLTGLRREVLSALLPGRGESADTLRRRVAEGRGLSPDSPGWPSFKTSFTRALRLLEGKGALEVAREDQLFGDRQACATWVRLTEAGESTRGRVVGRGETPLGRLSPEPAPGPLRGWERLLEQASEEELARLEALIAAERARRVLEPGRPCPRSHVALPRAATGLLFESAGKSPPRLSIPSSNRTTRQRP